MTPEVGLIAADGKSEIHNLTLSGYNDYGPKWGLEGKMMIWGSDREGNFSQAGYPTSGNVYAMYFTKDAFDRSNYRKKSMHLLGTGNKDKTDKKDARKKVKTSKR
jgi:hypothetical protein